MLLLNFLPSIRVLGFLGKFMLGWGCLTVCEHFIGYFQGSLFNDLRVLRVASLFLYIQKSIAEN